MSQALLAIAMASVPALAFSAAQCLFPLIMHAYFYDTGLFNKDFELDNYVTAFPSDWTLRKASMHQATRDTLQLGDNLMNKRIYMACDKGNKKGVGHFVKYLSWWDPMARDANGLLRVQTQLLDIDASGDTSADCARAIRASMNKLKIHDDADTHKLFGQCTDSGGGGVLDSLADEMRGLGLIWLHNYLIANCTIHALQLQLRNAVIATFGAGGLDKVNATQMLHSVYALQESIDLEEWRHILIKSSQCVTEHNPAAANMVALPAGASKRDQIAANTKAEFEVEHSKIVKFHSKFNKTAIDTDANYTGTMLAKMTQPMLTRWWTVGAAASFVFDYYLQIFHACQTIINVYGSDSSPYKIASILYAMMKDPETFIDMTLIRGFNKAYLHPHLRWLQESDNLTGTLGFQSNQIAVRYCYVAFDLKHILTSQPMKDYMEATRNCGTDMPGEAARHLNKLHIFVREARDSLEKHFGRWIRSSLLPAALLSETPLARVVACAMLSRQWDNTLATDPDVVYIVGGQQHVFNSCVHKRKIDLERFGSFIRDRLEAGAAHTQEALAAAELIVSKIDLRRFDYDGTNGGIRFQMHSTYLPLPSQTQFVESGVKEAKNVSSTDRSEELRTALAIVRSATPLGKNKEGEDSYNASKIKALIRSAVSRSEPHVQLNGSEIKSTMHTMRDSTPSCIQCLLEAITRRIGLIPRRQKLMSKGGSTRNKTPLKSSICHSIRLQR